MSETTICHPSADQFFKLSAENTLIPVYREIIADLETPVSVYAKVFSGSYSCLLESVEGGASLARYSFIAGDPFIIFQAYGQRLEITEDGHKTVKRGNFVTVLRALLAKYKVAPIPGLPRFFGGAVGYVGYDAARLFEKLPNEPQDELGLPDVCLIFPESVIVFDHYTSRLKIIVNARIFNNPEAAYRQAVEKIEQLTLAIRNSCYTLFDQYRQRSQNGGTLPVMGNMTRHEYSHKVEKIKSHIYAGDILQAVLSQRFETQIDANPFDVYRMLRTLNPSPYMYYLDFGEVRIAGSSPEMLVRLDNGVVETRPIAGTRPRGKTPVLDKNLEEDLLHDAKERAEHVMLVDLGRNDLGRVSQYGSIEIPTFMTCERYSHVMHLVSEVKGILRKDKDALDAFLACFPAGTVSGAPKIRAMEIIDELEPTKRGPYAGAVGYFSFTGNMDTCITIRTIIFARGKAYAQAGAGIVADSQPEMEYDETVHKVRILLEALKIAGEGVT
ncbi:MAG TPA: anthranilate synthase component I [Candidatus Limnocylindrales bacterium]|nr:anthranilate synthase component I [Candidatus Limnocylindrales bacterium]